MKTTYLKIFTTNILFLSVVQLITAQNPISRDQFTADPSARIFNGKVYVFPSHDIIAPEGKNLRPNWFCMEDYHVFSSENLSDWKDHGVIVTQSEVPWVDANSYSMWAPDCIERNGKYYFYFPANKKPSGETQRRGFGIGVAIADKPEGPYIPQEKPIEGINGIDPNVFIDKDGQAYIYWSLGNIFVAKLKENMLELDSEPQIIANLPEKGLKEGPWVFERSGIYYLTFPHVENKIERLEYAIGDSPVGPFTMTGVIMDESPMNCWTNHHSFIEKDGQWYLFYHQNAYSPKFDKNRSICIDSMFFNTDGTIQKVIPTLRGVGLTHATEKIQIDRYSAISSNGIETEFNDTLNTFAGWKSVFENNGAWIQYNSVDFSKKLKSVKVNAKAENGVTFEIHLDNIMGQKVADISIPGSSEMQISTTKIAKIKPGVHNLVLVNKGDNPVEVDWILFSE